MTTIKALPEEILFTIFGLVDRKLVARCQYVCEAWYLPAHLTILKYVSLTTEKHIEQFIRSIDRNPNPLYVNAVKIISLDNLDRSVGDIQFDRETIRKILHRFPNLERASFDDGIAFLYNFDDELCIELLKCCPKLKDFSVHRSPYMRSHYTFEDYNTILQKVRLLVKRLDVHSILNPPNGIVQFFTTFPQLKVIDGMKDTFDTLAVWLPIFENLDSLQHFKIITARDDVENFAEKYFTEKTEQVKNQMIGRFANIKTLTIANREGFLLNSYRFVAKYFTGLTEFDIISNLNKDWTDVRQRMFCDIVGDFARFLNKCNINLSMTPDIVSEYLPLIMYKMFNQPPTDNTSKVFIVRMVDDDNVNQAVLNIDTNKGKRVREIEVVLRTAHSPLRIAKYIQKASDFDNVDEFKFEIPKRDTSGYKVDVASYDRIMAKMTLLKRVFLDVPPSFRRTETEWNSNFPLVEQVTFQASIDGKFQSLLDKSCTVFPNLKHLRLYYFSGIWHPLVGEFRVDLGRYKLKQLTVDITPVQRKMEEKSGKKYIDERKNFFVVVVESLASGKRQLYSANFRIESIKRIYDEDLEGFVRGESYLRVHITVASLEMLDLCKSTSSNHRIENYFDVYFDNNPLHTQIDVEEPPYLDDQSIE